MSDDYQNSVLADTPALYWRLDEVGPGANEDQITDLSGNDLHGVLDFVQPGTTPIPYGYPSPIETDSSSREFQGFNDGIFGATRVARIGRESDSLIEPLGDFALEGWLRLPAAVGGGAAFGTIVQPMFGRTGSMYVYVDHFDKIAGVVIDSSDNPWLVISPESVEFGVSYHVVLDRLGDALVLRINSSIIAQTTISSSLPNKMSAPGTFLNAQGALQQLPAFFVHPFQIAACEARYDEVAFYTHSIGARALAHNEAALNVLNMRGECNIRTSATLSGGDEPDAAEYSFRHNWTQPVVERFRWRTGIFTPTDGPTQLARQRSALRRQVEYQHLLYSEKLRRQFEARAFGGRTGLVQFEPDKVRVEELLSGATTAQIDTRHRDFEVDQQVLIYENDDKYEFHMLSAVTDDAIEWDEGLSQSYTRPWIKPARTSRLPATSEVELHNDVVGEGSTIYEYLEEDEPLFPRRLTPFSPTLTYHAREVFDLREWQGHDYSELPKIEYVADRSLLDDSTGVVSAKQYRWGAQMAQVYNMNLQGRELIAKYLGWLYQRMGQYSPFWMPTFKQDLKPLSRSGNVLLVEGHEYSNYYANADNRADLAFIYFDNTVQMRRIESFNVDGDNDALSLESSVPTITGLRWLSFLRRVILSSDDVEIAWHTDDTVRVAFAVVDALLDIALGSPSVSPSPSASISHSVSPSASSSRSLSSSASLSPSASISPTISPSSSPSQSSSASISPSSSVSPSV